MQKIMLLDTSIGTSNMGDHIIMECVRNELATLLSNNFVYEMPTHLPAFNSYAVLRNSYAVQNYTNCDLKFAGGSNLLVKNLLTHYPQWNINLFNSKPLKGVITVGVGAGAGEKSNFYTKTLYRSILSHSYIHSVRDERSKKYIESLGLKAINTGCATMWCLTPAFCSEIPKTKSSRAVFTLNGRSNSSPVRKNDQILVDIIQRNYHTVFFWVQGDQDFQYFKRLKNTDNIHIIPPSVAAYHHLLCDENLDYIGTRLHGGIYAMRHKKRSIIIAIDERTTSIHASNNLVCIDYANIPYALEDLINSSFSTEINMPVSKIEEWKSQFNFLFEE